MRQARESGKELDLVTLGETMIRHYTRSYERLEQSRELGFSIAGSESNVAVAAARIGLRTGWIGKLVRNPLGEKIEREIRVHGVDTSRVVWTEKGRVGSFYIEFGSPPRSTVVIYDRKGSAASTLRPDEIDLEYIGNAKWFHSTGITAALGRSCLETLHAVSDTVRRTGTRVALDLNYREKLWSPVRCRKTLSELLPKIDLLISTHEDLVRVFHLEDFAVRQARNLQEEFGIPMVLITCGSEGAVFRKSGGELHEISFDRFPVREIDRIGAGDAYAAGFLAGLIEKDAKLGLLYGAGLCALKYSISGDLALTDREELSRVIEGKQESLLR